MNNYEQFIYWLDGFLAGKTELSIEETKLINEKLNSFFNKVTPNISPSDPPINQWGNPLLYGYPIVSGYGLLYNPVQTPILESMELIKSTC